jgi:hypothetical protein
MLTVGRSATREPRMTRVRSSLASSVGCAAIALALAAGPAPARAEDLAAKPGDTITWVKSLKPAYEQAEKDQKPLMICINSERVDGGRVESAAKELRENTYRDPRVVTRSRQFICAFLTSEGSSDDFGELRARYKIDGLIVSPQHIFARPDGTLLFPRQEFWPHGTGENSIKALLALMDDALAKEKAAKSLPPAAPGSPAPAPDGAAPGAPAPPAPPGAGAPAGEQAAWLAEMTKAITAGPPDTRREALRRLLAEDKDGTNLKAILDLLPALATAKDVPAQEDVIRALGRPGLKAAVPAVADYLGAKEITLRGNAAVTLEYIGAPEAVDALKKRVDNEKVEIIVAHLLRAIGRCGAGDAKVRNFLERQMKSAKEEIPCVGAVVGLAHFPKDAATARALEEEYAKVAPPGGGRRGWSMGGGAYKGTFFAWALAEVGDPKSADFMRKKKLPQYENQQWPGVANVVKFLEAVAQVCDGNAEKMSEVDGGIQGTLSFFGGNPLMDEARRNRDGAGFVPKADWDPAGRGGGAGGGGGGNPPGKN